MWKVSVTVKMNFAIDSAISVGHQIEFTGCKSHSGTCDRDVCSLPSTVRKAYGSGCKVGSTPTRNEHLTRVPSRLRVTLAMVRGELKGAPINAVEPSSKSVILMLLIPKSCSVPPGPGIRIAQTESKRVGLGSFDRTVQLNSAEPPFKTEALLGSWSNV